MPSIGSMRDFVGQRFVADRDIPADRERERRGAIQSSQRGRRFGSEKGKREG